MKHPPRVRILRIAAAFTAIAFLFVTQAAAIPPQYARNYSLDSSGGLRWLHVLPAKDATAKQAYAICGAQGCPPGLTREVTTLRLPLRRAICLASAHIGFLAALDLRHRVAGVSRAEFVYDSALLAPGNREKWKAVGPDDPLDWETVASLRPDVILYSAPPGGESRLLNKARALGIPALATAEWLENHPLGRAEWIRVYGVLFGAEAKADSLFAATAKVYDSLRAMANGRALKPRALYGLGWRGSWNTAGGGSYAARLMLDAGIRYLWEEDRQTGSLSLGLETVLRRARDAEIWINPGASRSMPDLVQREPRASAFRPFGAGKVYQNDVRLGPGGGNDYWESGPARPDRILADLIRLAEGKLDSAPGYYYRRLPSGP